MKLTKKKILISLGLFVLLLSVLIMVLPFGNFRRADIAILSSFGINGFLWSFLLINEVQKRAFSFTFMHWTFCLLFFFFAALVQYINDKFPWINYRNDDILFYSNAILLLWTIGFYIGNRSRMIKFQKLKIFLNRTIAIPSNTKIFLTILLVITLWRVYSVGFINLFARSTSIYHVSENSSISLILEHSIAALAYYAALFTIISYKHRSNRIIILTCVAIFIAYPPTGLSRYEAAAIYLGLMLTEIDLMRRTKVFVMLFLGGFFIALPFLNAFRNTAISDVSFSNVLNSIVSNFDTLWLAGDYDAYTMLTLACDYIETNGISCGYQLLGVLFFWIPRNFWITKPIGSGAEMANSLGWHFTNLSCPLPAEALINFSLIGVLMFALFIGYVIKLLDNLYWKNPDSNRLLDLLYPVVVILFFFMCRGDLMSSFSYMMAYIFIGLLLAYFNSIYIKINLK